MMKRYQVVTHSWDIGTDERLDFSKFSEARKHAYPGKERRKAFARAQELRKQFPGIPYEQDTEKRSWER